MKNKLFFALWILGSFFIWFLVQEFILNWYKIENVIFTNLITFLSIIFWFYITSLSIFMTSSYVSELYNIEDPEDNSQTLLHKLINNYKIWLFINMTTIIYLIIVNMVMSQWDNDYLMLWSDKALYGFIWIFLINIYYSYKMLSVLLQVIIQEWKRKK